MPAPPAGTGPRPPSIARGAGNYAVASDGNVRVTAINGRECTFTLTNDELRRITELLGRSRRSGWKASYVPEESCCDRFAYTLTVDEAGAVTKTEWIDDPLPMPDDLAALVAAMVGGEGSIRAMATDRCK